MLSNLLGKYLTKGKILLGWEDPVRWSPTKAGLWQLYKQEVPSDVFEILYLEVQKLSARGLSKQLAFLLHCYADGQFDIDSSSVNMRVSSLMLKYSVYGHLLPKDILYYKTLDELERDLISVSETSDP